jgi:hypothetical protein
MTPESPRKQEQDSRPSPNLPNGESYRAQYLQPLRLREEDLDRVVRVVEGRTDRDTLFDIDTPLRRGACYFLSSFELVKDKIEEVFPARGEVVVGTSRDAMLRYDVLRHLLEYGDSYDKLFAAVAVSEGALKVLLNRPVEVLRREHPELPDEVQQVRESLDRIWQSLEPSVLEALASVRDNSSRKNN